VLRLGIDRLELAQAAKPIQETSWEFQDRRWINTLEILSENLYFNPGD
jgi:hypothetical protein